jgi:peroxiredoxin/predicted 2-oxoglutarate/Fe(II)-dependent dioxygenase YbiX
VSGSHLPTRRPPAIGDIAPDCMLPQLDGTTVNLREDAIAGNPIVLLFCPRAAPSVAQTLSEFTTRYDAFAAAGARLFAVTTERAMEAVDQETPFSILLDRKQSVFQSFGATPETTTTIVLRPNHHVIAILKAAARVQARDALAVMEKLAAERKPTPMAMHPPVLIVPDVLSREDCRRLITSYDTRGRVVPHGPGLDHLAGSDYKMRIPEHSRRDRIDHVIFDKGTSTFLDRRLATRLFPEIAKAFHYQITRYERLRIGCYEGHRGGKLHGHRDIHATTPYRRFAMSLNLNTEEFTGGELRFPEFGDQRYTPASGTAIVFSSALLHEALEVKSGRRLVLLAFLFGEY